MALSIDRMSDLSERVPYQNPDFPLLANRGRLSAYRNMEAACHWHDDLEISVALSGRMSYTVNGQSIQIAAGQGIFINARQLHSNFSPDGVDCEYAVMLIHPALLCANEYVAEKYVRPLARNSAFTYALLTDEIAWQAEAMALVVSAQRAMAEEGRPALTLGAHAHRMASLLFAHMPAEDAAAPRVDQRLGALRRMVGHVQRHYAEHLALSDIAAAGGVSRSTCCQIFRQHMERTPVEYLTCYRLEKAMALLEKPDLSVTEVALAVGFSGPSYFAESFRRELGITPSAFRRGR